MTEEALDPQVQIKGLHYLPKRSTTLFEKPQVSVQKSPLYIFPKRTAILLRYRSRIFVNSYKVYHCLNTEKFIATIVACHH